MKIGVVSDTHRNQDVLQTVADWLIDTHRIVSLYHLGDDYQDVSVLADRGVDIVQAPGIYHPGYRDKSLPASVTENVMGLQVMLVHSFEKDVTDEDQTVVDIILHGHTHHPELKLQDGHLWMNPGHCKGHKDKNTDSSFGLLDVQERQVTASIFNLDYAEIERLEMYRAENGLFKK
jgi:putative phosphoesterase